VGDALVLGAASFCALGVAVASVIRNAEAAPAVVQRTSTGRLAMARASLPAHSSAVSRSGALMMEIPPACSLPSA
jgi:ABC-2 type transport system permease protein